MTTTVPLVGPRIAALAFVALAWAPQPPRGPAQGVPSLDPLLQSAVDELRGSDGYCFEVDGSALLPCARLGRVRSARTLCSELLEAFAAMRIHGCFERGAPLLLSAGSLELLRSGRRLVFRRRIGRDWQPWAALEELADTDPQHEVELLRVVAQLTTPDDLLADLGARATARERRDDRSDAAVATFEWRLWPSATSGEASCTLLRITVDHGRVARIELEGGVSTEVVRYRIRAARATKVAVPESAARLLERP